MNPEDLLSLGSLASDHRDTSTGNILERFYTKAGEDVRATVEWGEREASITEADGKVLFHKIVEAPVNWSDTAVNIAAYKYMRKAGITADNKGETSVWQMITRVADTIANAGIKLGHFKTEDEKQIFQDELRHILLHQKGAFNSPVWFNCGLYDKYGITTSTVNYFWNHETQKVEPTDAYIHPQCSACFIQSIEDSMDGILDLIRREGTIFKLGSGTGTNYSTLRSRYEKLSGGGTSSGLMSFLKVFDANAGSIKSGGTTRRAAKMDIVDIDHPEVIDFIWWKAKEEDKAKVLIEHGGLPADFNGEAYSTVSGQNSNNSVRVTDEFMLAYKNDGEWSTRFRSTGEVHETYKARDLMRQIAEAAWRCADPGMQYDTVINKWHTAKNSGRINASNPCSEYMFLDDTACNLASINLVRYLGEDGVFDIEGYVHTIKIFALAQEIIVDFASYPSEVMATRSHEFRTLGLGYANLGALLMILGLPYDSDEGRAIAASLTAILSGQGYVMSSHIAERVGPFPGYKVNEEPMLEVIKMHKDKAYAIDANKIPSELHRWATTSWDEALEKGKKHGYRNAQISVLAPTGTIAFLMDCDTTGIEPDYSLVKWKKLAGGGGYQIVNRAVPAALKRLGYSPAQIEEMEAYILENGTIEGAPHMEERHLAVFDCANPGGHGTRFISPMGHLLMMAAAQPFVSGAISKTVNMPEETTVEEIEDMYTRAWELGIKALALYRNNSKGSQPLSSVKKKDDNAKEDSAVAATDTKKVYRQRELPQTRQGVTHKVSIGGHKIYITANTFDNGELGEVFIQTTKEGSTMAGLLDTIARMMSKMLQRDVPLEVVIDSMLNMRFEPNGVTNNPDILFAQSISDYLGRWLGYNFLPRDRWQYIGLYAQPGTRYGDVVEEEPEMMPEPVAEEPTENQPTLLTETPVIEEKPAPKVGDGPSCSQCGTLMIRNGSCFVCTQCGMTTGCS